MDFDVNSASLRQRNNELTRLTVEFSTLEDTIYCMLDFYHSLLKEKLCVLA